MSEFGLIKLAELKLPEWDIRVSRQQLEQLKADIQAKGILDPLVIDSQNRVLGGVNRYLVAQQLGLEWVPFRRVQPKNELEAFRIAVDLERTHAQLGPLDYGKIVHYYHTSFGLGLKQIAQQLGFSKTSVDAYWAGYRLLLELDSIQPPALRAETQKLLDDFQAGRIGVNRFWEYYKSIKVRTHPEKLPRGRKKLISLVQQTISRREISLQAESPKVAPSPTKFKPGFIPIVLCPSCGAEIRVEVSCPDHHVRVRSE